MTDRICFVWRMMKIYNTPSETVFSIDCRLYKEWAITKNVLHMVLLFLFNYVYRRHGRFPSFVWISYDTHFQNFSLGVFISVFCSLMSCLISKHEVLDIYIWIIYFYRIFLWRVARFIPPKRSIRLFGSQSNLVFVLVVFVWICISSLRS